MSPLALNPWFETDFNKRLALVVRTLIYLRVLVTHTCSLNYFTMLVAYLHGRVCQRASSCIFARLDRGAYLLCFISHVLRR